MKKVVKFGGSSLADSEQFKKVGEIIKSDPSRVYVIPSAPGKRFSGDEKVTDLLYKMHYKYVRSLQKTSQILHTLSYQCHILLLIDYH